MFVMDTVDEFEAFKAMAFNTNNNRRGSQSMPCTPQSVKRSNFSRESSKSVRSGGSFKRRHRTSKTAKGQTDSDKDVNCNGSPITAQRTCYNHNEKETIDNDLAARLTKMTMMEIWQKRQRLQRQSSLGEPDSISSHDNSPPVYANDVQYYHQSHHNHEPVTMRHSDRDSPTSMYRNGTGVNLFKSKHGRSFSCRDRGHKNRSKDNDLEPMRPRTSSVPSKAHIRRPDTLALRNQLGDRFTGEETSEFYLVRTFSTSKKGLINRGDSFKRRKTPITSNGYYNEQTEDGISDSLRMGGENLSHASSACSIESSSEPPIHRILMVGSHNVGKSSLLQQFTSSDYIANLQRDSFYEPEEVLETKFVSILLDGEEATLYIATATKLELDNSTFQNPDAYMVVYSVSDHNTYEQAVDIIYDLRHSEKGKTATIILVANKGDMVRNREVSEDDGKATAVHFNCKYVEVSAVLNLKVDELLAGVVKQIRLINNKRDSTKRKHRKICVPDDPSTNGCIEYAARGLVSKIFRKSSPMFRSCDNLLVL